MARRVSPFRRNAGRLVFLISILGLSFIFVNDWFAVDGPPKQIAQAPMIEPAKTDPTPAKEQPKAVVEAPPEVKEPEPKEVAEAEKPAGEDPWAGERERLQKQPGVGRIVVPRIVINGNAFAAGNVNLFRNQIQIPQMPAFPGGMGFAGGGMIDPEKFAEEFLADVATRRAAGSAQMIILRAIPEARHFISGVEVSPRDGHLILRVRESFLDFGDAQRQTVMEGIAEVWRDSKYVKELDASGTVEFRSSTGWRETLKQ